MGSAEKGSTRGRDRSLTVGQLGTREAITGRGTAGSRTGGQRRSTPAFQTLSGDRSRKSSEIISRPHR